MPSAKQQPSNIKHGGGIIRPNVLVLTLPPPPPPPISWSRLREFFDLAFEITKDAEEFLGIAVKL